MFPEKWFKISIFPGLDYTMPLSAQGAKAKIASSGANMKRYFIHMFFLCLWLASSSPALGVMDGLSTEELTTRSDLIVIGSVQGVESMWSEDGKTIISRAKIIVHSVIHGKWDKILLNVEYVGGEVGDIGLRVSDVKPLAPGENVLLFLKMKEGQKQKIERNSAPSANEEIYHSIVGNAQGHYTITPEGIAKKDGFSVIRGDELIDRHIPLKVLVDKIQKAKK
jgi:hypothetical protein